MTVQDLAAALAAKGHDVQTYARTRLERDSKGQEYRVQDALRIVGIDGKTFAKSGAEGNAYARQLLGQGSLSKRQVVQRARARSIIAKSKLTPHQKITFRRANKILKSLGQKPDRMVAARRKKKREGAPAISRSQRNKIRHFSGFAYKANVEWLIAMIQDNGYPMPKTLDFLIAHPNSIKDSTLKDIMDKMYDCHSDADFRLADDWSLNKLQADKKEYGAFNISKMKI